MAHVSVLHTEAVSLLVDAEPNTLKQTKSIIEAARNGKGIYTCRLDLINIKHCCYSISLVHHIRLLLVFAYCLLSGRKEVVEILLEAGMDPNCFDGASGMKQFLYRMIFSSTGYSNIKGGVKMGENRGIRISLHCPMFLHFVGSCPLHEAVRYFRYIYTLYCPKHTLYCPEGGHIHSVLP